MFRLVFLVFLAVAAAGLQSAVAQPRRAPDVQPLDQVLPQIRRDHPGTFYDADGPFTDEGGNPHYRLKWMTPEGRVIWLDTDARTGRVLGVEHGKKRGGYRNNMPPPDAPPPDFENSPRGRYNGDGGDGNAYRGRGYWEHGPGSREHNWNGRGGQNGWGGGQDRHGGDHDGHGGGRGHHGR